MSFVALSKLNMGYIEGDEMIDLADFLPEPLIPHPDLSRLKYVFRELYWNKNVYLDAGDLHFAISLGRLQSILEDEIFPILYERYRLNSFFVDAHDSRSKKDWLFYHSINTMLIAFGIGLLLEFSETKLKELMLSAVLHDIGKGALPEDLVCKSNITNEEKERLREHTENLICVLQHHNLSVDICYGVWQHHEKVDGSGYPKGIKGDKINLFAKIIAAASSVDNMTHLSPLSRFPMLAKDALEQLCSMSAYDNVILRLLSNIVAPYPVGASVQLSNMNKAVVVRNNNGYPMRPTVASGDCLLDLADSKYKNISII